MRAAEILNPLHMNMDNLNPGCCQSLVLVNGSYIQLVLVCAHAFTAMVRCKSSVYATTLSW